MKSLRRYNIKDTYYFLTIITYNREKLLLVDPDLFWVSWQEIELNAWVILPDHFHALIYVADSDISQMVHRFKIKYSRLYRDKYRPGRVWQNRFWDHVVRDQTDLNQHLDYIHYNPVRHGLTDDPFTYQYSSLQSWFQKGYYTRDWGNKSELMFEGEYGE